jgi:hypothetical protein
MFFAIEAKGIRYRYLLPHKEAPMSFDDGKRPNDPDFDPLTAPIWNLSNEEDVLLAPAFADYGLPDLSIPRPVPRPPDVDQILRGEYTGWIPVIKTGESLAEAENRVANIPLAVESQEFGFELQIDSFSVSQPLTMPRNLGAAQQPVVLDHSVSEPVAPKPVVSKPSPAKSPNKYLDDFAETFDTANWLSDEDAIAHRPNVEDSQNAQANFVAPAQNDSAHSLELVIMRDEIQDLRARLDASQKLMEEMMHKFANIAELALKSRFN